MFVAFVQKGQIRPTHYYSFMPIIVSAHNPRESITSILQAQSLGQNETKES